MTQTLKCYKENWWILFYRLHNKRALWKIISHHSVKKEKSSENIPSLGSSWILVPVKKWSRSHLLPDILNLFDHGHISLPLHQSTKAKPTSVVWLRMEGFKNFEIPECKPLYMTLDNLSILLISYWSEGSRLYAAVTHWTMHSWTLRGTTTQTLCIYWFFSSLVSLVERIGLWI